MFKLAFPTIFFALLFLVLGSHLAKAQAVEEQVPILQAGAHYGIQWPGGDLSARFGYNGFTGLQLDCSWPSGWTMGLQASLIFGKNVKEDVLAFLRDENGLIYGYAGAPSTVLLRERGQYYGFHLGYFLGAKRASGQTRKGLMFQAGIGLIQHKIRIISELNNEVLQLNAPYKQGYDRLSNGLGLRQSLGYRYLSANRRINFSVNLEAYQGFTQNRRNWNIDQMRMDTDQRLDLLFGIRINWILPFYLGESGDEIEY